MEASGGAASEKDGGEQAQGSPYNSGWNSTFPRQAAWDDRVAINLGFAFHHVETEEYEQWHHKGFRAKRATNSISIFKEEDERPLKLMTGFALRKCLKR